MRQRTESECSDSVQLLRLAVSMLDLFTRLLFIIGCHAILGCAASSILLVNLTTNDLRTCPINENSDACVRRLENLGYTRADRLKPEQKASLGLLPPY